MVRALTRVADLSAPLFTSGTARGGTNLLTVLLNVHPDISLAIHPYLPLFKSFRNALIAALKDTQRFDTFDGEGPLDEYYYSENRLAVMRLVQSSDLDLQFDQSGRSQLLRALKSRTGLSSPLLVPHLSELQGETYKNLFESALRIVSLGLRTPSVEWLGFTDSWTVEFFPSLARAFPDARFIILIRDVRSAIASQARVSDPTRIALPLSFVRCWRKQIALTVHYQRSELFNGRLHVMTYEELVRDPQKTAKELCQFLGLDYTSTMIEADNFVGPTQEPWVPNTNFSNVPHQGIYLDSVDRWKTAVPVEVVRLIEFVAGPDLEFAGYDLNEPSDSASLPWDAYEWHVKNQEMCQGWRTDSGNPDVDFALDLLRQGCLRQWTNDSGLVERCFLFPEVYRSLYQGESLFPTPAAAA